MGKYKGKPSLLNRIISSGVAVIAISLSTMEKASATCGVASFYGHNDGFHGRTTASGERFNKWELTAASRILPLGARIRVTDQSTGRSVIVRINDRGPYTGGRILDLSYAAFSKLRSPKSGLANVCYRRL